nr:5850_t:CDS:2 [Entrophospora candida]
MQVIGPEIAKISNFVGQETPDDFIRKIMQVLSPVWAWSTDGNVVVGNRANATKNPQFTQFYHQPDQNIAPQPFQNIVPQPIQNITPQAVQQLVQPTYYKINPKAYVEDTYGPGTWALDKRDIGILETLPRKLYIDNEENRPDDPMDIDYILYNLSRQLPVDNAESMKFMDESEDETYTTNSKIATWDVYETDMKELKKVLEYLITIVKNPSHENTSLNEQQPVENTSNIQPAIENVTSDVVTIKCRINKLRIPSAVLDSSANCSIMSLNIAKKLGLDIDTSRTTSLEGVATESDTIGWVHNIPVSVGFFTLLNDFIVVNDNKPALLLGTPWLDKVQAMIDFQSRILYIRNSNDLLFNVLISVHKSNDKKKS